MLPDIQYGSGVVMVPYVNWYLFTVRKPVVKEGRRRRGRLKVRSVLFPVARLVDMCPLLC